MSENTPNAPRRGIDLTLNIAHIIVIGTLAVGLIGSHFRSEAQLDALTKQATSMQLKLDGLGTLLVDAAVTRQRMTEFERRLDFVERR